MTDQARTDLHLVRVTMTDLVIAGGPATAFWIAAVPRDQATAAVAKAIPPDWTVELIEDPVSAELGRRIHLAAGGASELSSAVS